jgi:hypothetical protein
MRKPQIRAVLSEQFDQVRIVGQNVYWLRLDLGEHALVEVLDLERHRRRLAHVLTRRNHCA